MSILRQALRDYLQMRRAVGYRLTESARLLHDFVTYVENSGSPFITEKLALDWATTGTDVSPHTHWRWLSIVGLFAAYVLSLDPRTEVPRRGLLPYRKQRHTAYLYNDEEVLALITATNTLHGPLKPHTYATVIGLLAVTGMRVGEVIALDRSDVSQRQGLLVVRHAKFGKTRKVPLHTTTAAALRRYACQRDLLWPQPKSRSFFVSNTGTRLQHQNVGHAFARLLKKAGMPSKPRCRPRIHDLRHSFAIHTLKDWYQANLDVEARLPALSTYLGHTCPTSTYWYLTAVPELLCLAAERLENHIGGLP